MEVPKIKCLQCYGWLVPMPYFNKLGGECMFFHSDLTFVFALIALVMGVRLLIKIEKHGELKLGLHKFLGYVVVVLALLALIFSGMCATKRYSYKKMMRPYKMMMQPTKQMQSMPMMPLKKAKRNRR